MRASAPVFVIETNVLLADLTDNVACVKKKNLRHGSRFQGLKAPCPLFPDAL